MTKPSVSDRTSAINSNPVTSLSASTLLDEQDECLHEASALIAMIRDQNLSQYPKEHIQSYLGLLAKKLEIAKSNQKLISQMLSSQGEQSHV